MWRFIHLTDPHLASQRDGVWNNRFLCTMMPEVMGCLRTDLAACNPDFILATGDLCSHQTKEAMFDAHASMESLGVSYYPMGGNHDFVLAESREWFLDAFGHRLPDRRTYYSFTHKNLHFCVLDPWWKWRDDSLHPISEASVAEEMDMTLKDARWAIPPEQFHWLEADLRKHHRRPTLIASHYPALPVPPRMRRPDYMDSGILDNGDLLIEVLERFPQVKAIFSGHMHMHYITASKRIVQVVTGALPEYPVEYREITVHEDHMEIKTAGLSNSEFAQRSLIPGRNWTSGTPRDRSAVIALE